MESVHCPKCGTEKRPGRPCTKCLLELGLEPSVPRIEHVGAYRILSRLGVGAMGEVFRARDPRLDRDVAIKVLPEALANDEDRIARFRRLHARCRLIWASRMRRRLISRRRAVASCMA